MVRVARAIAFLLIPAIQIANAQAAERTLNFAGTINAVVDASTEDLPSIDFDLIPVGSSFSGTITYDTDSPLTNGGTGFTRYADLVASTGSLTINGLNFTRTEAGSSTAIMVSEEGNFGFSGVSLSNQPLELPAGWSVPNSQNPYFTLQFRDPSPQTRSLALPSSEEEFPTDEMNLVLDFQQSVTVAGETYDGRVYVTGEITSISMVGPVPPPQEVAIDLVPSNADNKINLNTKKPKPLDVAVFGGADFDVLAIVLETIELGDPELTDPDTGAGQKVAPVAIAHEDVNADGELDLVLTFDLLDLQAFGAIDSSSTSLEFQGMTENDGLVFGSDSVSISGHKGKHHK